MAIGDLGYAPNNAWDTPVQFNYEGTDFCMGVFTLVIDGSPMATLSKHDTSSGKWTSLVTMEGIGNSMNLADIQAYITRFIDRVNAKFLQMYPGTPDPGDELPWQIVARQLRENVVRSGKTFTYHP